MVGAVANMKLCELWRTGEDGLCRCSSAIQTRLGPSSLLEERSGILFRCFLYVVGYPPYWGKRLRYMENIIGEFYDQATFRCL